MMSESSECILSKVVSSFVYLMPQTEIPKVDISVDICHVNFETSFKELYIADSS